MRRLLRLWWVGLAIVPFGLLGWLGVVYAGVRTRRWRWVAAGGVYAAMLVVAITLAGGDEEGWVEDVGVGLLLASWVAQLIHSAAAAPTYLRLTSGRGDLDPELARAQEAAGDRAEARRLAHADPARALELGVGRPDLPDSFDGGLVDLNNAPLKTIQRVPGISRGLAKSIVRMREEVDGFSSLEDLGHVLHVDGRTLDEMRRHVVVLPRGLERV
jgi:Helix-hairpin-helix motif